MSAEHVHAWSNVLNDALEYEQECECGARRFADGTVMTVQTFPVDPGLLAAIDRAQAKVDAERADWTPEEIAFAEEMERRVSDQLLGLTPPPADGLRGVRFDEGAKRRRELGV
jgi:hypothetical protein